jgi:GTPase SAR1 family protein
MEIKLDGRQNPKFRLIMLGSKKVGKTSLLNQTINNFFRNEYYPTKDLVYVYLK